MSLAIFLVYLVMASQLESFLHPFVIIFTLPLGAIGVIGALALTGRSINIVAMIGAVMLAGIVVNNAIVLVDAVNQRRRSGMGKSEALIAAGSDRLRPILMTSATTILGLLPMALGLGEGAELRAPLAITVIGGLTVATLLTLVVIPVVYSLVDRQAEATEAVADTGSAGEAVEPVVIEPLREAG
jgi:HAE1 family hydrophobic/amphiphilic exporter-1